MPNQTLEELRWVKFPVLDDGYVTLVDAMGDDAAVVRAARVSYGKDQRVPDAELIKGDKELLRYLYRHFHTTPFEMCEALLLVRVPMDCWRQWIRHRTASVNEYSTRYTEAIDSYQKTSSGSWRLQSQTNKQGSTGKLEDWPETELKRLQAEHGEIYGSAGQYLSAREKELCDTARAVYEERLAFGVAKEQARKDLPLSTYTEAYWKCDLKNLLHFLSLRMDSHAQLEIRSYAEVIGNNIVAKLFPECWAAFNTYDFRRGGLLFSALDIEVVKNLQTGMDWQHAIDWVGWSVDGKCRERDECAAKLQRLGFTVPRG